MSEKELAAKVAALEARNAAQEKRLAALESVANKGLGIATAQQVEAGKGHAGTGQLAMNRASVPKHITDAMVREVPDAMVGEIVRDAKR
jgi:hypothetical protein